MKRCRSIWRAIRRGHPVNFFYLCYESRKKKYFKYKTEELKVLENAGK